MSATPTCVCLPLSQDKQFPRTIRDATGAVLFTLQYSSGLRSPEQDALERQLASVIVERLNAAPFPSPLMEKSDA